MPNSACQTKKFLHRIMTGDEKWIYFQNPKRKKSWVDPAQSSTSSSINRFRRKTMLCVWWDQEGVIYYELLKPGETVNAHRYHHQQLIKLHRTLREKRPHYRKRHDKLIFLQDNAPSHTSMSKTTWRHSTGKCSPFPLTHQALSDYHLFSSMDHALAERHFNSYEDVRKWLNEWFASKDEEFFWRGIHKLPERWEKCIVSEGKYFE